MLGLTLTDEYLILKPAVATLVDGELHLSQTDFDGWHVVSVDHLHGDQYTVWFRKTL